MNYLGKYQSIGRVTHLSPVTEKGR